MSNIIFKTQKDWVKAMKKAASLNTKYINRFPYNLLYKEGNVVSADCSNFQKALFNGGDPFNLKNGMNAPLFPHNTGDVSCEQLIQLCTNNGTDFKKMLKEKEPALLHMPGHIGAYIGEDVTINGKIYNVIEWTGWNGDFSAGCIYSYITGEGKRTAHKGSPYICYYWTDYGYPTKWVNYVKKEGNLWDTKFTKELQTFLGCACKDGKIKGQIEKMKKYCPAIDDDCIAWGERTDATSLTIMNIQKLVSVTKSGHINKETIKALNEFLNVSKKKDSITNETVKAFKKYMKEHKNG